MSLKSVRNAFFSGLILITPLAVTLFLINFLVSKIGKPTRDFFFPAFREQLGSSPWMDITLSLFSTLIVLIIITIIGWFSQLLIGRFMVTLAEKSLAKVPLVKGIYSSVKQIVETFSKRKKAIFQKIVLVEFPLQGSYAIGFLTGEAKGEIQAKTKEDMLNIFVPTTPNPTSGFLIMVPRKNVHEMDMKVSDGMKLIISGGAVVPEYYPKSEDINTMDKDV